MNLFLNCLVIVGLFNSAFSDDSATSTNRDTDACFCDEELGCFYNNAPWTSLMRPFPCPWNPEKIATKFKLFTRESSEAYIVTQWPKINLDGSDYDASRKTVLAVHGFYGSRYYQWMYTLKDVLLKKEDVNFIVVDWSQGSGTAFREYFQAASNTRTVGAELGRLLKHLISLGQAPSNIHCIGHSLGAHICGYAAKDLKKHDMLMGEVTGLDVAQPGFERAAKECRVAQGDAKFFSALHTDAVSFVPCFGFGMVEPLADVDFYINGGSNQPGCSFINVLGITSISDMANISQNAVNRGCSHKMVTNHFIAAVEKEDCMIGKKISSTSMLSIVNSKVCVNAVPMSSNVGTCSEDTCAAVGLGTIKSTARGSFLVEALGEPPYCVSAKTKRSASDSSSENTITFWETVTSPFKTFFRPLTRLWTK